MRMLISLICGHYLGDFGLQNDFVAKFKVPKSAPFWYHVMTAHCAMHAGIVLYITHKPFLAALEFVAHFTIDVLKCKNKIGFNLDQALHIICKCAWFGLYTLSLHWYN